MDGRTGGIPIGATPDGVMIGTGIAVGIEDVIGVVDILDRIGRNPASVLSGGAATESGAGM